MAFGAALSAALAGAVAASLLFELQRNVASLGLGALSVVSHTRRLAIVRFAGVHDHSFAR